MTSKKKPWHLLRIKLIQFEGVKKKGEQVNCRMLGPETSPMTHRRRGRVRPPRRSARPQLDAGMPRSGHAETPAALPLQLAMN